MLDSLFYDNSSILCTFNNNDEYINNKIINASNLTTKLKSLTNYWCKLSLMYCSNDICLSV